MLEKLQKLKNDLASLNKPELTKSTTMAESWKVYYSFLSKVAEILEPVFPDKNSPENTLTKLLKDAGCTKKLKSQDAENLKFWAQFAHVGRDKIAKTIHIRSVDLEYSETLEKIAKNPNLTFYYHFFPQLPKDVPETPDAYIRLLCLRMMDNINEACKRTADTLNDFLKTQEKPKTGVFDYLRPTRTMA